MPDHEITVDELATLADVTLIDVRETDEYTSGHVPGAVHLPLSELAERAGDVPDAGTVYVICAAGGRSAQAIDALHASTATLVNVVGGTNAWRDQGRPLVVGGKPE